MQSGTAGPLFDDLAERCGLRIQEVPIHAGTVRHQLTHLSLTFQVFVAAAAHCKRTANGQILRWVPPVSLSNLSISTAQRKALRVAVPFLEKSTPTLHSSSRLVRPGAPKLGVAAVRSPGWQISRNVWFGDTSKRAMYDPIRRGISRFQPDAPQVYATWGSTVGGCRWRTHKSNSCDNLFFH